MMREEDFRGGVHALAASLFAVMGAYNVGRLLTAGARHHGVNAAIYLPLWGFELYQTWHHWRGVGPCRACGR